ncbi:EpsG family protein [Serratia proteamaculans]|uniref:EpsG family protein n=1 Tax=Serratia proteamaculans TaxID=28151 RepID=UPI001C585959|nr:EpsG family protein [Serratia proteamaculans]WEO91257.1 EpsG family protein [Serratia proteamaculans]
MNEINNSKYSLYVKIFILPIIVLFFSYLVGIKDDSLWKDYETYASYFSFSRYNNASEIFLNGTDPFFLMVMKPFTFDTNGFYVFTYFCALVTLSLKFTALYKSTDNFFILIMLYSSYLLCLHDYVQIRIALALSLVIFSIYVTSKTRSKIVFFILAGLIHLSSIVFSLAYLGYKVIGYKNFIRLLPLSLLAPTLIFSGLLDIARLDTYVELVSNKEQYYQINIFASLPILQLITVLFIAANKNIRWAVSSFEYCLSLLGVVLFYALASIPVMAFRFSEMSIIFYLILLSNLFNHSNFIKLLCLLVVLAGLKNSFWGEQSLLNVFGG